VRLTALLLATAMLIGCADGPVTPSHASTGTKVAVRTIKNKTQQFGLEDTLASAVRDELLRDGRFPLVPENEADAVIAITLTHYLYNPIGYDVTLAPISYKLRIAADTDVVDRRTSRPLFKLENLEGSLTFPAPTLVGGSSESQAQATIWTVLAPMIVSGVADGIAGAPPTVSTAAASTPPAVSTAPAAPAPR
jgi:hypothetical protein